MNNNVSQPMGIFDSGIGGLTVAHAISEILPDENIIYFGDTAFLPYGDKSADVICARALKIADFLVQKKCKLIVIACNSASAVAFELLQKKYKNIIPIANVIDPVVNYAAAHCVNKTVGLIGTHCTINSNIYADKLNKNVCVKSLATPLLVPMIEKNMQDQKIVEQYLSDPILAEIDSLILGCTHYPLIKQAIEDFYAGKVEVLDSPQIVAAAVKNYLAKNDLLNLVQSKTCHFYVSNLNDYFASSAQQFFGAKILLEHCLL